MAIVNKTANIVLAPPTQLNAGGVGKHFANLYTNLACSIFIHYAPIDISGNLSRGVEFRIEANPLTSTTGQWFPIHTYRTGTTAPTSRNTSGTVPANTKTIDMVNTTNLEVGDLILFKNPTIADSEFGRIQAIDSGAPSITVFDITVNDQDGSTVYNQAEFITFQIDLTAIGRIRLIVDGAAVDKNTVYEAHMMTGDSIS